MGPPLPAPPGGDQIVLLRGVPWAQYEALCRARSDMAGPRLAYLDGDLEIMSPGRRHELEKTLLARLLEIFALENRVPLNGFGSETFRRKAKRAGVEPDECYSVGHARKLPDLAIEVVETVKYSDCGLSTAMEGTSLRDSASPGAGFTDVGRRVPAYSGQLHGRTCFFCVGDGRSQPPTGFTFTATQT